MQQRLLLRKLKSCYNITFVYNYTTQKRKQNAILGILGY